MADKKTPKEAPEAAEAEATSEPVNPARKKALLFGGGLLSVVATGFIAAQLAVPGVEKVPLFEGPFVALLSEEPLQANLSGGSGGSRFVSMHLNAVFDAYHESYLTKRVEDPLFQAMLTDALLEVASRKSQAEMLDPASAEVFREEIRAAVDPLLFPVHIGDAAKPTDRDSASGLRGGLSIFRSTLRGALYEHELTIDATARTVALDGHAPVTFQGDEQDLPVAGPGGEIVYVDVTGLEEGFVGTVHVGTYGRVRRILKQGFLVQ